MNLTTLRAPDFMRSRIPAQDALEAFLPTGAVPDAEMREQIAQTGYSRWYPVEDGHRLLTLYEGGPFNPARFTLVKGGWDHEHCNNCGDQVAPMELCWVTRQDPYILLDEKCYRLVQG
jgi:hypothetical protein